MTIEKEVKVIISAVDEFSSATSSFSKKFGALDEITSDLGIWDSYFGCWQKK